MKLVKRVIVYLAAKLSLLVKIVSIRQKIRSKWDVGLSRKRRFPFSTSACSPPTKSSMITSSRSIHGPELSALINLHRPELYWDDLLTDLESQTAAPKTELIFLLSDFNEELIEQVERRLTCYQHVQILNSSGLGVYGAWNLGLGHARSEFVTNVNDDDRRLANSFGEQIDFLSSSVDVDVAYTDFLVARSEWQRKYPSAISEKVTVGEVRLSRMLFEAENFPHAFPAWRLSLHDELGEFREDLTSSADVEFWLRCLYANKRFAHFDSPVPQNVYFWNEFGVSSASGSRGPTEWASILTENSRRLTISSIFQDL